MHRLSGDSLRRLLEAAGYQIPSYVTPIEAYLEGPAAYYRFDVNGRTEEIYEADLGRLLILDEPPRPDPLLDRELAALSPQRDPLAETWREAVPAWGVHFLRRQEERRRLSWLLPEQVAGEGGPGLSNGPYRAASLQDGKNANWLTAEITYRPGTTRIKLAGKLTPTRQRGRRGQIRAITRKAMHRWLEFIRELETKHFTPEWMITLTYGRDWRGQLGRDAKLLGELRAKLKELDEWRLRVREMRRQAKRLGSWPPHYDFLMEAYQGLRAEVRRLIARAHDMRPDGKTVKRHLDAFIKRFDRAFGTAKVATYPTKEEAEKAAEDLRREYPAVRVWKNKKGGYDVIAVLYRLIWWMEFQRRGAPHLHILLFDTRGLDIEAIRRWAGPAWAGVVNGLQRMDPYLSPELAEAYDNFVGLWGKRAGEELFEGWLSERGLSIEVWRHMRAGTRVEKMQKATWGYAAKEGHGGRLKLYQKTVPRQFRNIGRWWGKRNYKREKPKVVRLPMHLSESWQKVAEMLAVAEENLPMPAFKFRKKLSRLRQALAEGERYAYLTVWGKAGTTAFHVVEEALSA